LEGSREVEYKRFEAGHWQAVAGSIPVESVVRLHVNGQEAARLICTPLELDHLALGFMRSEGWIEGLADVRLLKICPNASCVDVWLRQAEFVPPARGTLTSGCGGGVTFTDLTSVAVPVTSELRVSAPQICALVGALGEAARLYQQARGVHTAALARGDALVAVAEDVGRHNTLDKLWGHCLVEEIPTADGILVSTGRISSEMLFKAARMGIPVIASRTSPTALSVALATAWNLTLIGYVRRDSLNVYTGWQRLIATFGEERSHAHA
jgi:FdhD protein